MYQRMAALTLLAICNTCQGGEPPIPIPSDAGVIPPAPVETRPALPSHGRQPRSTASEPPAPLPGPQIVPNAGASAWIAPVAPLTWDTAYVPQAVVPPTNGGLHVRHPYYSYRRPWYPPGPPSLNVTIVW